MKIIKITSQHRRDFWADMGCENCRAKDKIRGYDDRNFHDNVIPEMKCKECGKSRNDLGIKSEPTPTRHAENEVV